ncbi:hypothetical protein Sjap_009563 [Stephania japonica]|uniref:Uncharacterized protein n=1 Tax=Stephania japonica TaxID=461633 RepID=A0AAP0PDF2_9MAGN
MLKTEMIVYSLHRHVHHLFRRREKLGKKHNKNQMFMTSTNKESDVHNEDNVHRSKERLHIPTSCLQDLWQYNVNLHDLFWHRNIRI